MCVACHTRLLICRFSQLDPARLKRRERRLGFKALHPRFAKVRIYTLQPPALDTPVPHIIQLWLVLQILPV